MDRRETTRRERGAVFDIAVTLMLIVTLGAYLWSARGHFRSDRKASGTRLLEVMVFIAAATVAWQTWGATQSPIVQGAGLALQVAAFVLFWLAIRETRRARLLAAFTDDNPASLVTTGPYRFVRHPFYASYILFWFGGAISTGVWWTLIPAVVISVIYWRAAIDEEDRFAKTAMAADYAEFKRGRARFFPGLF